MEKHNRKVGIYEVLLNGQIIATDSAENISKSFPFSADRIRKYAIENRTTRSGYSFRTKEYKIIETYKTVEREKVESLKQDAMTTEQYIMNGINMILHYGSSGKLMHTTFCK